MDIAASGILCIALLLLLLALGVQIGLAFILGGFVVSVFILGFDSSVSLLGLAAYFSVATPTWAAIPLFILMGAFASRGGLARRGCLDRSGDDETCFLATLYEIAESGHTPAEVKLEQFNGEWGGDINHIFREYAY